jgi:tryptophan-rich sensory protein
MRRMDWAFYEVIFLWVAIVGFIVVSWPVSHWAALLFVPYLAWVTTAATLNWTVWSLNPRTAVGGN